MISTLESSVIEERNDSESHFPIQNNIFVKDHAVLSLASDFLVDSDSFVMTTPSPNEFINSKVQMDTVWKMFNEQYLRHSLEWTVALVVAYTLILVIGIVGNIMVILVVALRPQMRTVTNMFIMNLAVADLFVIVFCVPATLLANIFTPWILGSFMCKAVAYVQGVSVCASAYSLAAISLDRCKAIYRALGRPRGLSKYHALSIICLIWVVALLMIVPWAVTFNVIISHEDGNSYCVELWSNQQHGKIYFLVANLIFCYSIPLILISISNVSIWCHVSRRKVPQDSASANTIKKMHRKTRHGVRKMLGIVTFTFLLSWLPLYVIVTRVKFAQNIGQVEENLLDILMPLAQWLGSWNSSVNPVLYAFLNSKFREMFISLLPSWVPFIPRKSANFAPRNSGCRATVSNGTFAGTVGNDSPSPTYFPVSFLGRSGSIARSRRSRNSRSSRSSRGSRRTVLVSSFRNGAPFRAESRLSSSLLTVDYDNNLPSSTGFAARAVPTLMTSSTITDV